MTNQKSIVRTLRIVFKCPGGETHTSTMISTWSGRSLSKKRYNEFMARRYQELVRTLQDYGCVLLSLEQAELVPVDLAEALMKATPVVEALTNVIPFK